MAHSICNLKCNGPNEIPVDFHNGSNYDYSFIIKKLANEFVEQLESLGENTEKYKPFSVPIEKEVMKLMKMLLFLTKYNLLIVQDLWQVYYRMLLIISQK